MCLTNVLTHLVKFKANHLMNPGHEKTVRLMQSGRRVLLLKEMRLKIQTAEGPRVNSMQPGQVVKQKKGVVISWGSRAQDL